MVTQARDKPGLERFFDSRRSCRVGTAWSVLDLVWHIPAVCPEITDWLSLFFIKC